MIRGLLSILIFVVLLSGCENPEPVYNRQFLAFGTVTNISIIGVSHQRAEQAADIIENDFKTMHNIWHAWNPGPLNRTNQLLEEGEIFSAPPSLLPLFKRAKELAIQSDHLFNPTIGKLLKVWGFQGLARRQCTLIPDKSTIETLVKANPTVEDISLEDFKMQSHNSAVQLDFGAIGKGFGIDLVVDHLKEIGIKNAIVNSGGDLRAIGSREDNPWRIAIRSPSGTGVIGFIESSDNSSIFTSGNYERNFSVDDKLYHHILDPRTGYPADKSVAVTVIHDSATTADAAATALFIAGPDEWPRIAAQMGVNSVLLVDNKGVLHMSPEMEKRVRLLNNKAEIRVQQIPDINTQD